MNVSVKTFACRSAAGESRPGFTKMDVYFYAVPDSVPGNKKRFFVGGVFVPDNAGGD